MREPVWRPSPRALLIAAFVWLLIISISIKWWWGVFG